MVINLENSVLYHYDKFPPKNLDYAKLIQSLTKATDALSRYDQLLKSLHNSAILLAPLRNQEAVLTSRMEGTVSTLDEILEYEAQENENSSSVRDEIVETILYARSLNETQQAIQDGQTLSPFLLRQAHQILLSFGRGKNKSPGEFKTEQNYLTDKAKTNIAFTPIAPEALQGGLDILFNYIENDTQIALIKTAIAHVEFEALHPFKDGNGRIGRMLITLMLWSLNLISEPHFYMSPYLEENKDLYIDTMRNVSENDNWDDWCVFFFKAVESQAIRNLTVAEEIFSLYEEMKIQFSEVLSSKWSVQVLDFVFTNPIFKNNKLAKLPGISPQSAHRFTKALLNEGIIRVVSESSGRRGATYAFESLLVLVRV
jgi:Fic family protein